MLTPDFLEDFNPAMLAKGIATRAKARRLEINLTQQALAGRSGVSLGSLKRFEATGEISLKSLLGIAIALDSVPEFRQLFSIRNYQHIEEIIASENKKSRKRGRIND